MAPRKRIKQTMPLIIEDHPTDYTGFPFITLIQFRQEPILAIIDNTDEKTVRAYVIDQCGPAGIKSEKLLQAAEQWFETEKDDIPLSIALSRNGLAEDMAPLYCTFNIDFISRAIGPFPNFPMNEVISVKRRRRKPLPSGIRINRSS